MELEQAIKIALSGDAILFLGSGASVGATNYNDRCLPIGSELAVRIFENCSDLQQAVDLFLEDKEEQGLDSEQMLIDLLKNEFNVKNLTESQKSIPVIPWKRIYTTNYDNVVEKSYEQLDKNICSVTLSEDASKYLSTNEMVYLHINGYINKLFKDNLNTEFKLSEVSYNTDDFSNSKWGQLFKEDLKTYSAIIFIGFSLRYDLDIRRILSKYNKNKLIFILSKNEPENNVRYLKKYGSVECIGLDGFFDKVASIKETFIPVQVKSLDNVFLTNFVLKNTELLADKPSDVQVLSYYKTGKRENNLFFKEKDSYKAIIKRSKVDEMIKQIEDGVQAIFIHSDIGNGKTELIEQLCYELSNQYMKYLLIDDNEKISQEIELICKSNNKNVIIIENFFNYYDVYRLFDLYGNKENTTFIFTSRTSIYQSRFDSFSFDRSVVYDLNRLDDSEIRIFSKILDEYGYFPRDKYPSLYNFIKRKCNSKLQSVLLEIFENSNISKSLSEVKDEIFNLNEQYYKIVLFMVILKVMSLDLDFEDALNLLGMISIDYKFEKNYNIKELIYFNGRNTSIKSVALCVWIIKNSKPSDIIDILIKTANIASIGYSVNKRYLNFLGNIISYKHLKFVFNYFNINSEEKLKLINLFYESIKNFSYYQNKYFFWLQYGISALEMKDYVGADMHFNAAYNKLPDGNKPFEIDNQYARLIMEKMLLESYKYDSNTITEILRINDLLTPTNAEADDEFYCYKMSDSYYPKLFEKFYNVMSKQEKNEMLSIVRRKYSDCQKYIMKNNGKNFIDRVRTYCNTFMNLSFYMNEDILTDFFVLEIKKNHVLGYIIKDNKKEKAYLHISQISNKYVVNINDYLKVGDVKKAKIVEYSDKYGNYIVSLNY